ncbi:MAG TPA: hypothetical protein GXZ88_08855 [Firmicutes bacterium]|nr:hypothetical protein [Candidatus Fermentithermobacillaceae bacterium]
MNKPFVKELLWTNYLLIGGFALIIIAGNLYYGTAQTFWNWSLGVLAVLALTMVVKIRRIKARDRDLDERTQLILYKSIYMGFYFFLGAILWYYTKEMVLYGQISTRTLVELLAGGIGYVGSYLFLRSRY